MKFVDSHCHLQDSDFDPDREEVISRALNRGVTRMICIGASDGFASNERALELSRSHDSIWCTIGIHPNDATSAPFDVAKLKALAEQPRVVAIGETGLDFFRDRASRSDQYRWFRAQVELAHELKKPIIIHSRNAGAESIEVLEEMNAQAVGGVFHCFAEDAAFAERLQKINFLVSFPGTVTFKKTDALREIVKQIPLEQIMLETDAPYLAPEPNRGKRCEPSYVVDTAERIAAVKGISLEEVARRTTETALKFYNIS